jgi:hypothetical protein
LPWKYHRGCQGHMGGCRLRTPPLPRGYRQEAWRPPWGYRQGARRSPWGFRRGCQGPIGGCRLRAPRLPRGYRQVSGRRGDTGGGLVSRRVDTGAVTVSRRGDTGGGPGGHRGDTGGGPGVQHVYPGVHRCHSLRTELRRRQGGLQHSNGGSGWGQGATAVACRCCGGDGRQVARGGRKRGRGRDGCGLSGADGAGPGGRHGGDTACEEASCNTAAERAGYDTAGVVSGCTAVGQGGITGVRASGNTARGPAGSTLHMRRLPRPLTGSTGSRPASWRLPGIAVCSARGRRVGKSRNRLRHRRCRRRRLWRGGCQCWRRPALCGEWLHPHRCQNLQWSVRSQLRHGGCQNWMWHAVCPNQTRRPNVHTRGNRRGRGERCGPRLTPKRKKSRHVRLNQLRHCLILGLRPPRQIPLFSRRNPRCSRHIPLF